MRPDLIHSRMSFSGTEVVEKPGEWNNQPDNQQSLAHGDGPLKGLKEATDHWNGCLQSPIHHISIHHIY